MSEMKAIGPECTLGEGIIWHPELSCLFWFDIPAGRLYSSNAFGGGLVHWDFGEPASACGWIDSDTLLVATASGLRRFVISTGEHELIAEIESSDSLTRSNDGRVSFDGSFWIGTMDNELRTGSGSYYRYKSGEVTRLLPDISVPNATCFSPDKQYAYLCDTPRQIIWRWRLDSDGSPIDDYEVHIDLRSDDLRPDGAVCDSEGFLWNAHWGSWQVCRYAPDGSLDRVIRLPVSQPTCPCFGGDNLDILFVTSARERLSESQLERQPDAGRVLCIDVDVIGLPENRFIM